MGLFGKKEKVYKIFFCWQSDIPGQREMLFEELQDQAYRLEEEHHCIIKVDEDTRNVAGMIPIADSVLKKIREADIFVCDISPVARIFRKDKKGKKLQDIGKQMPNSNVMLELGYALRSMHQSRIIAVANTGGEKWNHGEMPFDITDRYYVKFTNREDLDLRHELAKSIDFLRRYGRVDADGNRFMGIINRCWQSMFGRIHEPIPIEIEKSPSANSITYFTKRLSVAFPGISSKTYFDQDAIVRLKEFFNDAECKYKKHLVLEDRKEFFPIDKVQFLPDGNVLIGYNLLKILSIGVNRNDKERDEQFILVEGSSMDEVAYDPEIQDNTDYPGIVQTYAVYQDGKERRVITKQLYDDNSAFTKDGRLLSLDGKTQLYRIHLYDFEITIRAK